MTTDVTKGAEEAEDPEHAAAHDETRNRIHAAAVDLFRAKGFEATTESDIIDAAGVTAAELAASFESKVAILRDQAAFYARGFAELIPEHKPQDRSVHATMQAAVRRVADVISTDTEYQRVIWTSGYFFEPEGPVKDAFDEVYRRWENLFFDGQTVGEIHSSRDPRQLTEMLMGIVYLTITNWLTDWWGTPTNLHLRLARAVDQFLHGAGTR